MGPPGASYVASPMPPPVTLPRVPVTPPVGPWSPSGVAGTIASTGSGAAGPGAGARTIRSMVMRQFPPAVTG
ncbi:MAG: hypothetical protein NTX54_11000, partial [Chloroflexi bacterium]|nr:hypothetical protein [Chloroflexota bacterium]